MPIKHYLYRMCLVNKSLHFGIEIKAVLEGRGFRPNFLGNFQSWTHLNSQKPGFWSPCAGSGEVDRRKNPVSDDPCDRQLMSVGIAKWNETQPTLI
jgi:hypothetical protein